MQINYHKFFSGRLGQDFEFKVYGHAGKPVMVFPTSCGRFFDYENKGMIAALSEFIENGEIMVFAVDGRAPLAELSDEALAARAQQLDPAALLLLLARHEQPLYRSGTNG